MAGGKKRKGMFSRKRNAKGKEDDGVGEGAGGAPTDAVGRLQVPGTNP